VLAYSAQAQSPTVWTGFHVGLNAGGGLGNADTRSGFSLGGAPFADAPVSPENSHFGTSGFIGGGQIGYDTGLGSLFGTSLSPVLSPVVIGAEADFAGSTIAGSRVASGVDQFGAPFTETQKTQMKWMSTVRARLGYEIMPGWLPYLTGGLAVADLQATDNVFSPVTGTIIYPGSNSAVRTGGVVGAGLDYAVTPNWDIGAQYLYASFGKFGTHAVATAAFSRDTTFAPQVNILRLTLDYRFGVPTPPPPTPVVAAPPAPPPAAPAASKQMFIVFFEFDKSSLTPDGRKVVDAAAAAFKGGKTDIALAGYTDLAGTQPYNLALSHHRADTVKAALVKDGVPAAAIGENWYGKENPRVPTADGVREPQNRRVEITM
jgi:outer membrane protein OmpA-like peptidoglycan-associated protein